MTSKSEDINCNKILTLRNTSASNGFIFNVTLDISFIADPELVNFRHLCKTMLTTICCQIGHKYRNWKKCSCIIAENLSKKFKELNPSLTEWKGEISIKGQYNDEDSDNIYSEIIYDWFSYDGVMIIPPENSKDQHKYVNLKYTIRFFLNPTLAVAEYIFSAKGYKKMLHHYWTLRERRTYEKIMDMDVNRNYKYNHLRVWLGAYDEYQPPTFNLLEFDIPDFVQS
ncbi:hypothetical protein PV328_007934 [Microctonus aethiopoides]|uniref:Uncharacterized protein n=1 Tax=Microctonus aethiopoides TaxID=144406 RepID=A0AA39C9Z4_9HYME|nr:hypothetical protein PV328_007934 [Microctonus aethiopoides]